MQQWKLIIEETEAELPPDFDIEIQKTIADIRTMEIRQSDFLPEFDLPKSNLNTRLLHFTNDFDSIDGISRINNIDAILDNGLIQVKGKLMVTNMAKSYQCQLIIGNRLWLEELRGIKLNELDISDYNQLFRYYEITQTYLTSPYGVIWDFADRGGFNQYYSSQYPQEKISLYDLFPMFQYKMLLDKIFESIGWSISGSFTTSDYFKQWYLMHTWGTLKNSQTERDNSKFLASYSGVALTIPTTSHWRVNFWDGGTPAFGSNLSVGTDYIQPIANFRGKMKFKMQCKTTSLTDQGIEIYINSQNLNLQISPYYIGHIVDTLVAGDDYKIIELETVEADLLAGMYVYADIYSWSDSTPNVDYTFLSFEIIPSERVCIGNTINMSLQLPDMDCVDFITLLKQKFNLFFESDYNLRTVTIEPYADFIYDKSQAIDISVLIDKPSIELEYLDVEKKIIFDQKDDDNDYFVQQLKNTDGYLFGRKEITNAINSNNEIKEIKSIDSPLFFRAINGIAETIVFPVLIKEYPNRLFSNDFNYKSVKWTGMWTNPYPKKIWYLSANATGNFGSENMTSLPIMNTEYYEDYQVHTLTNATNAIDNHGLYNRFWANWTQQYFNKIVKCQAYLDEKFILNFTHRKPIYINIPEFGNAYFFVNLIVSKLDNKSLSQLELLKITPKMPSSAPSTITGIDQGKLGQGVPAGLSLTNNGARIMYNGSTVIEVNEFGSITPAGARGYAYTEISGITTQAFTTDNNGLLIPATF